MAVRQVDGVLYDVVDGRAILIGPAGAHVIELNGVGSVVWDAIDGRREVDDLVAAVRVKLTRPDAVPAERLRADVESFLGELVRLELVRPT